RGFRDGEKSLGHRTLDGLFGNEGGV
ncbi:MAG: hypothetical protein QOG18_2086, partial [Microbacteriaceae bacterium]|nr:hypothetical protein [Microbacteriaceae bacterium]